MVSFEACSNSDSNLTVGALVVRIEACMLQLLWDMGEIFAVPILQSSLDSLLLGRAGPRIVLWVL